jgi:nickel/cobalt exporter
MILLLLFGLFLPASRIAAQDPFRSPGSGSETAESESPGDPGPGDRVSGAPAIYSGGLPAFFLRWSRNLQQSITRYSSAIRSGGGSGAVILSFLAAVVFGMLHIIGPGHGKLFTFSYVSSRDARPAEGILLSAAINVVDSLSAAVLVFGGYGLLSITVGSIQGEISRVLQIVSYSLIILFSAGHLISHAFHNHDHHHDHSDQEGDAPSEPAARRSPLFLALSIGLVPCPVSTVLLIFGLVNGLVLHSVFMVIGVSLGGFISMAVMTLLLIKGRDMAVARFDSKWGSRMGQIIEFAGLGFIILVALVLLISQLA